MPDNINLDWLKIGGQSPLLNYSMDPRQFYNYNAPGASYYPQSKHWGDAGKLPGHPTFSNESIYANPKTAPRWEYPFPGGEELRDPRTQEIIFSLIRSLQGNNLQSMARGKQ